MKDNNAEIKKIVLDIGGKEVILTVEQARKLKEILSDMFGKEIIKEVIHEHHKSFDWWYKYNTPYYPSIYATSAADKMANGITFKDNAVYCSVL